MQNRAEQSESARLFFDGINNVNRVWERPRLNVWCPNQYRSTKNGKGKMFRIFPSGFKNGIIESKKAVGLF